MANTNTKNKTLTEIQQRSFCNWCRNPLTMSDKLTESNFVDTGKEFSDGTKAYAVYCYACLDMKERVEQPKSAINKATLDELNLEVLQDAGKTKSTTTTTATTTAETAAATTTRPKATSTETKSTK